MKNSVAPLIPPTAILFDLDGTLIDSIELIVRSFQHATAEHLGAPRDREEIIPTIGLSLPDELERIAPGRGDLLLQTYRSYLTANHDTLIARYDGVMEMLDTLSQQNVPLAIVTSKSRISARPSLAWFKLTERIDTIVTFEDTERHKPYPDPLFLGAERLGVTPGPACWYVGDSTHDMEAARAAGMTAIGVLWGPYGREKLMPLADFLLETPDDLLELLAASRG